METWRYRRLVLNLGLTLVRSRYRGTWIGWPWIPLRPAIDVGAKALFFGGMLGVTSGDRPYFIFFSVGMTAWLLFERVSFYSLRTLSMSERIYKQAYAPRLAPIVASVIPGMFDALLYLGVALVASVYLRVTRGSFYLYFDRHLWIVAAGAILLASYGLLLGTLIAPMVFQAKDIRFFTRYFTGFLFLFTPVIYPLSLLPDSYKAVATYNPLSAPVEMVKYGLLQSPPPSWHAVWLSCAELVVCSCIMLFVFGRSARHAAEAV